MELKHTLIFECNGKITAETQSIEPTYDRALKVFRAYLNDSGGRYVEYAMEDENGYKPQWEETGDEVYISVPFQVDRQCDIIGTLAVGIQQYTDGYFTFGPQSPYAGDKCYFKGFDVNTSLSSTLYPNTKYYVIAKSRADFDNLEIKLSADLANLEIEEPIGFDNLQVALDRHEYHGIGAEASLGSLEFYGIAARMIEKSYDYDIESRIWYRIQDGKGVDLKWLLDLSTFSMKIGKYKSISCKVCEEGIKTIFNNRTDIDVNLETSTTIDGEEIEKAVIQSVDLPTKHLLYTNFAKRLEDKTYTTSGGSNNYAPEDGMHINYPNSPYIYIPVNDSFEVNEYGSCTESEPPYGSDNIGYLPITYTPDTDHVNKYGNDTYMEVEIEMNLHMFSNYPVQCDMHWSIGVMSAGEESYGPAVFIKKEDTWYNDAGGRTSSIWDIVLKYKGKIKADYNMQYFLVCNMDLGGLNEHHILFHTTVRKGSYIKMKMYDNIEEKQTPTKLIMVYDALKTIANVIGENQLELKSDWFDYTDNTKIGGGAMKGITNGYKIRNIISEDGNDKSIPLSFKSAITSLNAIDCLGWGFSTETGKQCLRVERWDWFYQPNTIFIVNDAEEVTIDADPDRMISVFIVGYKKYATNDQYNSIDSPHGTREFVSSNKVINQTIDQQSEFIADNYAIEETRRNRYDKSDTEESTYDENIFIIELIKEVTEENPTGVIKIQPTSFNATNVGNENEFINAKITPRHMAARWVDYLFQSNNKTALKFNSGEINFLSSFEVIPEYSVVTNNGTTAEIYSLKSFESSSPQKENDDIAYLQSILKAETIKFSYPITISEYIRIKSNPYGLVHVNGLQGWIKNFKYSFIDGIAEFTLIAKKQ